MLFLVLFPYPHQFVQQAPRWFAFDKLIDPAFDGVDEANAAIDAALARIAEPTPRDEMRAVQAFVDERIAYEHDWETWGAFDYWPTAQQAWDLGREDCDGQAIVAASILRARGFATATIVGNLQHVWVKVDDAELMGPQAETMVARDASGRLRVKPPSARLLLAGWAYTLSEFPALRQVIVLLAALVLLHHPRRRPGVLGAATTMGLLGFTVLVEWGRRHSSGDAAGATTPGFWIGVALVVGAAVVAGWRREGRRATEGA